MARREVIYFRGGPRLGDHLLWSVYFVTGPLHHMTSATYCVVKYIVVVLHVQRAWKIDWFPGHFPFSFIVWE